MDAVFFNHYEAVRLLLEAGADTSLQNDDGNTAIYLAAYLCNIPIVTLLLEYDVDTTIKNNVGDDAYTIVSTEWNQELLDSYLTLGTIFQYEFDIERIQQDRITIATMIEEYLEK
jgi:ankyrin repeat protein